MRAVIRTLSFFEQWAAEVIRQPALMFTLVLAPFLLLLAFGEGVQIGGPRPRTLIVQPPNAQFDINPLLQDLHRDVHIMGVTESLPLARQALERGDVDAVAVVPEDPNAMIANGQQVPLRVLIGEIDPVRQSYARSYLRDQVAALNQRVVAEAIDHARGGTGNLGETTAAARAQLDALRAASDRSQAQSAIDGLREAIAPLNPEVLAGVAGGALLIPGISASPEDAAALQTSLTELQSRVDGLESGLNGSDDTPSDAEIARVEQSLAALEGVSGTLANVDPTVLSAPFVLQLEDVAGTPSFTAFYSPGVLSLLVQHLAVTLAALTLARMRLLKVIDVLRVAPVRPLEIVMGNYVSYAVLCGLAAAGLLAMLILVLDVPVAGDYAMVVGIIALLILASLGLGFLASQLSSSLQQAAQIAMLLLLASIFFGGFAFSLDRIEWPVRALSHILPATYAIRALQDVMLRGWDPRMMDIGILAATAVGLLVVNVLLLSRSMRPTRGARVRRESPEPIEEPAPEPA